ncbi:MAG: PAS domain S-box protein, partial [Candidatus Omnitrophota bacterium]
MIQHDPAKNARETLKILLMEARESDVRYVREILSEDNEAVRQGPSYALEVVDRLDKALRRLPQGGYDVILTDLALPDSTGIPTFRKLYDAAPDVAIVILGGDDPRLAADAVKLGAQDYLFRSKLNANNLPRILQYAAERKKIQRQVHQAEQRYRSVFENSAVAILLADSRGAVESWNQYTEKLFGMKSEDLHLKPLASLYGTKEWEKLCLLRSQRTVGAQERFETRMVRKNGRLMDVDVSVSPLKTPAGKEAGSLTIIRDITEKKRLERLKDEFVSSVSHELRTPLAITREAVAQMAEGILGKTTAKQKQFLRISLENLDRLARIVNDLLDISRLEAGAVKLEKERLDLTTVLRRIVESFEARARKKNITTVFSATAGLEVFA